MKNLTLKEMDTDSLINALINIDEILANMDGEGDQYMNYDIHRQALKDELDRREQKEVEKEKKVTKKEVTGFVKAMLQTNKHWAIRALMVVYGNQTAAEQDYEQTTDHNGVGFTGADAEFLTSLAKQWEKKGFLSDKQMVHLHKKISKYHQQVLAVADMQKVHQQVLANR